MGDVKDLIAFKKAYDLALRIFQITGKFPREERYSLTDQIRRSSRSVCVNIAESYQRRAYPDYFKSKLNDALSENAETGIWLDFAKDFGYISIVEYNELMNSNSEIGKLLSYMSTNYQKFI
jgi:four helix bundle protein